MIGILVSATDISKRIKSDELAKAHTKKLQEFNEELKRSNKDLEQFAYIASHDLKEPLRIIGNFSELLARTYKTKLDKEAFQYINFIEDGVGRMSNKVEAKLKLGNFNKKGRNPKQRSLLGLLATQTLVSRRLSMPSNGHGRLVLVLDRDLQHRCKRLS